MSVWWTAPHLLGPLQDTQYDSDEAEDKHQECNAGFVIRGGQ